MSNNTYSASGGSGAGYHAKIIITEAGYYDVVVGSGGTGIKGGFASSSSGGNGQATTFKKEGVTLISAGGGTGGRSGPVWATAGSGGTLSKNVVEQEVYVSKNGNNGNAYSGGSAATVNGASGPISGHTWGATGSAAGNYYGGAWTNPSYHGYFYIKYVGEAPDMFTFTINPTPSDATVTLTVDGISYTQSSITVVSGKAVSWSVSKSGYTTQTGTNTITEDITESVELEELQEPLYYCYRLDILPNLYYYLKTTNYSGNTTVYMASDASRVTNSSQLTTTSTVSQITYYGSLVRYPSGDLYT